MLSRRWLVPVVLIVVIIGAGLFRWQDVGTRSLTSGGTSVTLAFKKDLWTGRTWVKVYGLDREGFIVHERLASPPPAEGEWVERNRLAVTYWAALFLSVVWLAVSVSDHSAKPAYVWAGRLASSIAALSALVSLISIWRLVQYQWLTIVILFMLYKILGESREARRYEGALAHDRDN